MDNKTGYTPEKEFQDLTVKAVISKITDVAKNITELDINETSKNYEAFDPAEKANVFGKPELTIKEYFESEIKNLKAGIDIITDPNSKEEVFARYSALKMQIDRVFNPEDFTSYCIDIVGGIIKHIDKISNHSSYAEEVMILLSRTEEMVSNFNSYIKVRKIKLEDSIQKDVLDINKKLKHYNVLEIDIE